MSEIIEYTFAQTRDFMQAVLRSYDDMLTETLFFEEWKCRAMRILAASGKQFNVVPWDINVPVNVAYSAIDMMKMVKQHADEIQDIKLNAPIEKRDFLTKNLLKTILKPKCTYNFSEPFSIDGELDGEKIKVPIWFNSTMKSINVRLGFDKLDSSLPGAIPLSDKPVHAMIGGTTGSGKSVAINNLICTMLLEYPPWEVDLYLADFKVVELSRYANRIPTPHVKAVAATSSTDFVLSMFRAISDEMQARNDLFVETGATNISTFRKEYGLVMPRILLIVDEFVQMYENIKVAAEKGNDKADEQKQTINAAISNISRLGRSQGVHMLLSSQQLEGALDDQTAGQFAAGATLKAPGNVSTSLIGNDAGKDIIGKGKAYVNLDKTTKDVTQNILVRVPYIPDSVSEEEASKGRLSYLQELLTSLYGISKSLGWDQKPFYYNENEPLSKVLFPQHLQLCREYFDNPYDKDDADKQVYRMTSVACVPLGKAILFTEDPTYRLTISLRKNNNLLINADDTLNKVYLVQLLMDGINNYNIDNVLLEADKALALRVEASKHLNTLTIDGTGKLPVRYLQMAESRQNLLDVQNHILANSSTGSWDMELMVKYIYNIQHLAGQNKYIEVSENDVIAVFKACNEVIDGSTDLIEKLKSVGAKSGVGEAAFVSQIAAIYFKYKNSLSRITNNFTQVLTAQMFKPIFLWWLGIDEMQEVLLYDNKDKCRSFMSSSCQVGIFNVLVPSLKCSSITALATCCNFILEHCSKDFFMDIELPKNININANSFQIHDREKREHVVLRFYS